MLTQTVRLSLLCLCAVASTTGCTRWLTRTETVEAPRRQYVDIPAPLTAATAIPAPPEPDCKAADGKPTLCGSQLDEWITLGWAPALNEANRDKLLIRCLQAEAKGEPKPQGC